MRADVIVAGLGTMGAATAYHLATRGAAVVGLDRLAPPHHRGAHAGGSRIIRMAYMEGPAYVPLVREALRQWRDLEAASGVDLVQHTGGLMLGRLDSFAVGGSLATARAQNLRHELLDPDEIRARFPAFVPGDDEVGLYEEVAGLIRPEAAIDTFLNEARALGADLRVGSAVRDWRAGSDDVSVQTDAGDELRAARLVLAPGAWAPRLVRLPIPLHVQRRVQHYWRGASPELFEPGRLPVWIWSYESAGVAYGLPAVEGRVKAAFHHGNDPVDPDVGATEARADEVDAMRDWLATRIPSLAEGGWLGAKPCLYTMTPDEHFVVGRHPDHATVAVACGFSGHGFKFAPVIGEILADLALTGRTRHDIALFDPARFDPARFATAAVG
jgi:sarcosine oxidase